MTPGEGGMIPRMIGKEEDISHTLKKGRWAILSGGVVVEIRLVDPVGFLPVQIYRDIAGLPDVRLGWVERDGSFCAPDDLPTPSQD